MRDLFSSRRPTCPERKDRRARKDTQSRDAEARQARFAGRPNHEYVFAIVVKLVGSAASFTLMRRQRDTDSRATTRRDSSAWLCALCGLCVPGQRRQRV